MFDACLGFREKRDFRRFVCCFNSCSSSFDVWTYSAPDPHNRLDIRRIWKGRSLFKAMDGQALDCMLSEVLSVSFESTQGVKEVGGCSLINGFREKCNNLIPMLLRLTAPLTARAMLRRSKRLASSQEEEAVIAPQVLPTKRTDSKRKKRKTVIDKKNKKKSVSVTAPTDLPTLQEKGKRVAAILDELYPDKQIPLDHESHFQLLVSVLLSAQVRSEVMGARIRRCVSRRQIEW